MSRGMHHGVHPAERVGHVSASNISSDDWRVPTHAPMCNETADRCEIWVPSPSFGLATENEKRFAAKQFGLQRGEDGWSYAKHERAATPGWIVVRRVLPVEPEPNGWLW